MPVGRTTGQHRLARQLLRALNEPSGEVPISDTLVVWALIYHRSGDLCGRPARCGGVYGVPAGGRSLSSRATNTSRAMSAGLTFWKAPTACPWASMRTQAGQISFIRSHGPGSMGRTGATARSSSSTISAARSASPRGTDSDPPTLFGVFAAPGPPSAVRPAEKIHACTVDPYEELGGATRRFLSVSGSFCLSSVGCSPPPTRRSAEPRWGFSRSWVRSPLFSARPICSWPWSNGAEAGNRVLRISSSERAIETATASHLAGPPERHRSTVRDPRFSWLGGAGLGLERCLILTSGTALQRSWD